MSHMDLAGDVFVSGKLWRFLQSHNVPSPSTGIVDGATKIEIIILFSIYGNQHCSKVGGEGCTTHGGNTPPPAKEGRVTAAPLPQEETAPSKGGGGTQRHTQSCTTQRAREQAAPLLPFPPFPSISPSHTPLTQPHLQP